MVKQDIIWSDGRVDVVCNSEEEAHNLRELRGQGKVWRRTFADDGLLEGITLLEKRITMDISDFDPEEFADQLEQKQEDDREEGEENHRRRLTRQERLEGLADRGTDTWEEYGEEV